jgi:hypothetical protein
MTINMETQATQIAAAGQVGLIKMPNLDDEPAEEVNTNVVT